MLSLRISPISKPIPKQGRMSKPQRNLGQYRLREISQVRIPRTLRDFLRSIRGCLISTQQGIIQDRVK